MADFCWTRGEPLGAGMAREGHCDFSRDAGPKTAFAVAGHSIQAIETKPVWTLEQTFDIVLGEAARQSKTLGVDTTCSCGSAPCERSKFGGEPLRNQLLWFAEPGEQARVRSVTALEPGQSVSACEVAIGTRGPHAWGDYQQWTLELDVVARYCWRDGVVNEGPCG
jgi:hypothetical protein